MNKNSFVLLISLSFLLVLSFHFESSRAQVTAPKAAPAQGTLEPSGTQRTQTSITVTQSPSCYTLITGSNPAGGGTVTANVVSNCSAGVGDFANRLTPVPPIAPAGENPWEASRSLAMEEAFDTLIVKAKAGGPLGVIIGLKVPYQPEAKIIRPEAIKRQRADVARSQDAVLATLIDYDPATVKKYVFIPAMALRASERDLLLLKASPDVVTIEEDVFLKPSLSESVPLVGAPAAWASGFSGVGETVAILDSGVDKTHPFLFGKVLSEACYSSNLCPGGVRSSTSPGSGVNCSLPILGCSHGTHVAGIAAGKGTSFSGVARDAGIISIQVFSQIGDAQIGASYSDLLLGLQRVQELSGSFHIAAVNISLVGSTYASNCDFVDPTLKAGIDALRALNIATVVAGGNNGLANSLTSPACISSAISVGATGDGSGSTELDLLADFSNNAGFLNLLAPGDEILSSVPGGDFENHSGTSMAAPHVAGAWAILKSKFPSASVDQVLGALTATGKPVLDSRNGITKPRIQVDAAVNSLGSSGFQYSPGTMVTLTATPAANHTFQSWTGCDSVEGLNCTLAMSANRSVTANFTPITRTLTVTSNRDVGVTVTPNDNSGSGRLFVPFSRSITLNASVTLIAPATMGIGIFQKWQLDGADWAFTQSTTLTMDDNHTMTAVYENPIVKLQFGAANYEVNEGSASIAVEVTRTGFTGGAASVLVGTSDGTASQARDYTLAGGRVSFADGETSKTFTVLIADDLYVEPNETINLSLTNPLAGSAVPELGSPNTATVTVVDNDIIAPFTNPLDNADARFFVRQHYSDFLSRVPDTSGYDFWSGQITQCGSDLSCRKDKFTDVSNAFYFEPEFQQTGAYVYRLYRIAFGNNQPFPNPNFDPSHPGEEKKWPLYAPFMRDRTQVRGGPQLSKLQFDLAKAFVGRSEFRAKYTYNFANPIPFVDALLNTMNRDLGVDLSSQRTNLIALTVTGPEPGPASLMYYLADDKATNRLNNRALLDAEYNRAFVFTQYAGYLRRDADIAGLLFWLGQVDSAPLRDIAQQHAMVCSFITSAEYQRRFSSIVTRNNTECPH